MNIKFSPPDITDEEIAEVIDTLKSGWITTGPKTKELEKHIAGYCGTERAACLASATAAMELTLRLFGIGEGDEVITSAYTFTATASVIAHTGARIVLADTAKDSYEMDYDSLESLITERTKAIIPVDIAGVICNYKKIIEIAESAKALFKPAGNMQKALGRILILADAAHSFGAVRDNIKSGAWADFSVFSLHAVKNLTTGEGGAVTWKNIENIDNEYVYNQFMIFSIHGQTKDAFLKNSEGKWEYDIIAPYYKCNMTDIHASIGLAQLRRYAEILERRGRIVEIYEEALNNEDISVLKHRGENFVSSKHLYIVRLNGKDEAFRNRFMLHLALRDVPTNMHFKPLPLLTAYRNMGFDIKDFPNAYDLYKNGISLPLYSTLTDEEAYYIVNTFLTVLKENITCG